MKKLLLIILIIAVLVIPIFAIPTFTPEKKIEYEEPDVTIYTYSSGVLIIVVDGYCYLSVGGTTFLMFEIDENGMAVPKRLNKKEPI